jgi:hypothetical protein
MIPELRRPIDPKKYYRPQIIKLSKRTKRKAASVELFILDIFEKIYSFLTLSLIRNSIDNFIFIRKLYLWKFFEKKTKIDRKAEKWARENKWFGKDMPMTYTAFDIHKKLVDEEGVNPKSDKYYEELDKRIYTEFPDKIKKYFSTNN